MTSLFLASSDIRLKWILTLLTVAVLSWVQSELIWWFSYIYIRCYEWWKVDIWWRTNWCTPLSIKHLINTLEVISAEWSGFPCNHNAVVVGSLRKSVGHGGCRKCVNKTHPPFHLESGAPVNGWEDWTLLGDSRLVTIPCGHSVSFVTGTSLSESSSMNFGSWPMLATLLGWADEQAHLFVHHLNSLECPTWDGLLVLYTIVLVLGNGGWWRWVQSEVWGWWWARTYLWCCHALAIVGLAGLNVRENGANFRVIFLNGWVIHARGQSLLPFVWIQLCPGICADYCE